MSDALQVQLRDVRAFTGTGRARVQLAGPVSLTAHAGQLTCMLGPNGSGKTSVLRAIAGLCEHSGEIVLGEREAHSFGARERARSLAYVPQRSLLDAPLPVERVVAQGRYAHGGNPETDAHTHQALAKVGMAAYAQRPFVDLSLGEQRRVLIARALATQAKILLLDEPDAYLDVRERLRLFELLHTLRGEGHLLLVVVHALDEAIRHADRCILLHGGRVVADDVPARALDAQNLSAVFGVELVENGAPAFRVASRAGSQPR
ncbi:MAG TPA: ABC transporter ATP-binding protein [Polyangiales bacterium]|jgi:iron complex transport system ATP-binding protein|nr:ABC transporter ATP-binding protein [Polyangiales bacterium]